MESREASAVSTDSGSSRGKAGDTARRLRLLSYLRATRTRFSAFETAACGLSPVLEARDAEALLKSVGRHGRNLQSHTLTLPLDCLNDIFSYLPVAKQRLMRVMATMRVRNAEEGLAAADAARRKEAQQAKKAAARKKPVSAVPKPRTEFNVTDHVTEEAPAVAALAPTTRVDAASGADDADGMAVAQHSSFGSDDDIGDDPSKPDKTLAKVAQCCGLFLFLIRENPRVKAPEPALPMTKVWIEDIDGDGNGFEYDATTGDVNYWVRKATSPEERCIGKLSGIRFRFRAAQDEYDAWFLGTGWHAAFTKAHWETGADFKLLRGIASMTGLQLVDAFARGRRRPSE